MIFTFHIPGYFCCRNDPSEKMKNDTITAYTIDILPRERLYEESETAFPPRDGVSMVILISSRRGTASQRLF